MRSSFASFLEGSEAKEEKEIDHMKKLMYLALGAAVLGMSAMPLVAYADVADVNEAVAAIAHDRSVPLVVDLGSGENWLATKMEG